MMKRILSGLAALATAGALTLIVASPASAEPIEPCGTSIVTNEEDELIGQVQVAGQELTPCI